MTTIHHLTLEADSLAWRCEVAINEGHRVKARRILDRLKSVRDQVRRVEVTEELRELVMGAAGVSSPTRAQWDEAQPEGGLTAAPTIIQRISIRDVIAAIVGGGAALVSFWAFVFGGG